MGRPPKPPKELRIKGIEVMLTIDERKRLDKICVETEMTISELLRYRVLNLSESEEAALQARAFYSTIEGTRLAEGLRKRKNVD